ncbi:MAG: NADH-quinone oxidoreductase subunit K [Thiothrix litoralis]|jgi:multicomponent Na+:H+ antiporter subunit C
MTISSHELYVFAGVCLLAVGLWGAWLHAEPLRKVISVNVMGAGVFLLLITLAYRGENVSPDPLLHALVLTGIVVAISATALAVALIRRLEDTDDE